MTQAAAKFWDKHAVKYAASSIRDMAAYEYTLGRTRDHLAGAANVLEIGCGTGSTALKLAPGVGRIDGTDISPEMIRIATQKATAEGTQNAVFRVCAARDAAAQAAGYDAVLAFNLLHLTENPAALFQSVYNQLPPGGLFISKTPCLAEPSIGVRRFAFAALIPAMRLTRLAPFVHRFTFARLEQAITNAGFDLIEIGSFPRMSRYIVARRREGDGPAPRRRGLG